MTHRLTTNCAKNYCNRTLIVKVIVENVVTCFLGGHGVDALHKSTFHLLTYFTKVRISLTRYDTIQSYDRENLK